MIMIDDDLISGFPRAHFPDLHISPPLESFADKNVFWMNYSFSFDDSAVFLSVRLVSLWIVGH